MMASNTLESVLQALLHLLKQSQLTVQALVNWSQYALFLITQVKACLCQSEDIFQTSLNRNYKLLKIPSFSYFEIDQNSHDLNCRPEHKCQLQIQNSTKFLYRIRNFHLKKKKKEDSNHSIFFTAVNKSLFFFKNGNEL